MSIESILSKLDEMDGNALKTLLANSGNVLKRRPKDADALRLRESILREWTERSPEVVDGWTPGRQGDPRIFVRDGTVAASVHRLETHRSGNDGVYLVMVQGRELAELYRHVDDARHAAEEEIQNGYSKM